LVKYEYMKFPKFVVLQEFFVNLGICFFRFLGFKVMRF
jgi:hypothetical protein